MRRGGGHDGLHNAGEDVLRGQAARLLHRHRDVARADAHARARPHRLRAQRQRQLAAREAEARQAARRVVREDLAGEQAPRIAPRGEGQVGARRQFPDRPRSDDAPAFHQHQAVGQRVHLVERVGDVEDRRLGRVAQPGEEGQDLAPPRHVERGERLVHQQQARAREQGAAQRHALPLARGQPGGAAREEVPEAEQRHHLLEAGAGRATRRAAEAVAEVGFDRQVREQPAVLEHHRAAPPLGRDERAARRVEQRLAAQRHAPLARAQEARDRGQDGGLAAARRAEQRRHPGGRRAEGDVEREPAPPREGVAQRHLQAHPPRPSQTCIRRARTSASSRPHIASAKEISASRAAVTSPPGVCVAL